MKGLNKIWLIIIIASVIIIGVALYFSWQFIFPTETPTPTPTNNTGTLPNGDDAGLTPPTQANDQSTATRQKLSIISKSQASHYWVERESNEVFYFDTDGFLHKIGQNQDIKLDMQAINNIAWVKSSADGKMTIVSFGSPNATLVIFDTESSTYKQLPNNTTSSAWDPESNNRVAILRQNNSDSIISIFNISTGRISNIVSLTQYDLEVDWPLANKIHLASKPSANYNSSLWSVDTSNGRVQNIISDLSGLMTKWSPDGQSGLMFAAKSFQLIDASGNSLIRWGFVTLPSKCTMGNSRGYCAVPKSVSGATLPDDYLQKSKALDDNIYEVDFATGIATIVLETEQVIDADLVSFNKNSLFFINRLDGFLYKLAL
ncbi:MAG: hypothetical protein Q8O87_03195 [bacterium]|nr:hypothetical protein [bacterium]